MNVIFHLRITIDEEFDGVFSRYNTPQTFDALDELMGLLIIRFKVPTPKGLSSEELQRWLVAKKGPTQSRYSFSLFTDRTSLPIFLLGQLS